MLNTLCGNVFSLPGFKNIGGVVSVNCKVYIRILQFYTSNFYISISPILFLYLYFIDLQHYIIPRPI